MVILRRLLLSVLLLVVCVGTVWAEVTASLRGRVLDARSGEALVGATVQILQAGKTTMSDGEGYFEIGALGQRNYTLVATYLGYRKLTMTVNPAKNDTLLVVKLEELENQLGTATVTAQAKRNTEKALVTAQKNSLVVQSGISAQQISKSQDKDASEVIRRVPGISIIDQKFVMVRGLSQRYNNVWINGAAGLRARPTHAHSRSTLFHHRRLTICRLSSRRLRSILPTLREDLYK